MSADDNTARPAEIVIIRRKSGDDLTATKGGAWKIAYADFVTAMMAFFLVMWLINASNEATRAQVASYFNPIKLTDNTTGNRGLKDRKERKTTDSDQGETDKQTGTAAAEEQRHEAELMADSKAALEKISRVAALAPQQPGLQPALPQDSAASTKPSEMVPGIGDPFDPRSWDNTAENIPARNDPPPEPSPVPEVANVADPPDSTPAAASQPATKPGDSSPAPAEAVAKTDQPAETEEKRRADERIATAAAIAREIANTLGTGLDQLPASIDVKAVDDGVLISLTDKAEFGMFKTGSAEPEARLLDLVGAVASALSGQKGFIVVRGHTDSRPYRNKKYDNWQLSTARAHFAQYMLVRGGLDEGRIRRIEGMADREPRVPDDPAAAANRRIEILLGMDEP